MPLCAELARTQATSGPPPLLYRTPRPERPSMQPEEARALFSRQLLTGAANWYHEREGRNGHYIMVYVRWRAYCPSFR